MGAPGGGEADAFAEEAKGEAQDERDESGQAGKLEKMVEKLRCSMEP